MKLASKWPVKMVELLVEKKYLGKLEAYFDRNRERIIENYGIIRIAEIGPRHSRCYESVCKRSIEMCKIAIEFPIWEDIGTAQVKLHGLIKAVEKAIKIRLVPLDGFEPISVWDDGYPYEQIYWKLQDLRRKKGIQTTSINH